LFLLFLFIPIAHADGPGYCTMGDYQYTGTVYSDSYQMDQTSGEISCHKRNQLDEQQIGKDYKQLRSDIDGQIDKMLNDPGCEDTWQHLRDYRVRLKSHWEKFDGLTKERIEILKNISLKLDMQKAFAYMGAFNATCSG